MSFHFSHCIRARVRSAFRSVGPGCVILLLAAPLCVAASARSTAGTQPRPSHTAWVASWGSAMLATDRGEAPDFSNETLREIVHTSVGGPRVRVWFSNRFGSEPLRIGAAHVALTAAGTPSGSDSPRADDEGPGGPSAYSAVDESAIQPGSDRTLTFHHQGSVVIPPGSTIVSDPVSLDVPALANLSISVYFPGHTMGTTEHELALQTSYASNGDTVDAAKLDAKAWREHSWYFLSGVDVAAPHDSAVIAFGDSITDGWQSTPNKNDRWPDFLAKRLAANSGTREAGVLGVVNVGISGNRVLLDGAGPNAVSRIDRDIVARSGARFMIVLESINDIGRFASDHQPYGNLTERLEAGLAQMATQAHQHGMRVFGATLTPYQGCGYYSAAGDQVRQGVNQWIRASHTFDGVVDFDKAVRDPQNPLRFAPQYDSGDHLHPSNAGYKAMANAIDLSLFTRGR